MPASSIMPYPQTLEVFASLQPGDRVQVDHEVKVGFRKWHTATVGTVVRKDRVRQGVAFQRNFDDKDGWGAFELGLRYSRFDGSEFRNLLASATANASEAGAWTVGAKWILNPNARILLNYVRTSFDQPTRLTINGRNEDKEQAIVLRGQYDF